MRLLLPDIKLPLSTWFMPMKNKIFVIAALYILIGQILSAQSQTNEPILPQFEEYMRVSLQEKIYLHSDKNFYLAGEICWFKLYCTDASFNKPLDMSKVAYTELTDDKNKPVLQAKILLKDGYGNGSFQLPPYLVSGKYKIRSYTSWMKNCSANFFFEKEITIINAQHFYESDSSKHKNIYKINLFPEGGNLVNGIQSKIAFSVTDQNNKGISCEGVIVNEKNDTLAKYKTLKFGMGSFLFTPENNNIYKAVITLPDSQKIIQQLPAAFNNGYVMHLGEAGNNMLSITVQSPGNNSLSEIYLFAHTRGVVKAVLNNNIQNGTATFLIDKAKLGDGISHFTVFNAAKVPVCERLYFKFPNQRLQIKLAGDNQEYSTRKKITIHITTADQTGIPLGANLSMAVYRLDSLQEPDEMNIDNYLWLSSDLAGTIESPGYYFNNNGTGTEEAMDNLMMVQGWRRFRWENILQNKKPAFDFVPEYVGHIVKGKITDSATGVAAQGVGVYLSSPGKWSQFRSSVSDSNGIIHFDMKDFFTSGELILQTRNIKDSFLNIEILNPFSDKFSDRLLSAYNINQINTHTLMNHNVGVQVQNQYAGNRLNKFLSPDMDTIPFFGKPDVTYLLDNYTRFTTMEEVLREYVAPITLRSHSGKYELNVLDKQKEHVFFESNPLVLLDGVPVLDFNRIINYDPLKVKKLDIITQSYFYGNMAFEGILNFVTYNGHLQGFELDPHSTVIDYEGLQSQREFYSPVYDTKQQAESRLADFRNLIYWSPDIKTNSKGETDLSFYSSDLTGKFVAIIQGISADGKTGTRMIEFEVKK
jgi:hypothetical protein